jgi:O-Antigen ligase
MRKEERGIIKPRASFFISYFPPFSAAITTGGFWCLFALCLMLPFEFFSRFHLLGKPHTNLELMIYLTAIIAAITLLTQIIERLFLAVYQGQPLIILPVKPLLSYIFLGLSILVGLISSLISRQPEAGLDWTGQFGLYALIWAAVPFWLNLQRLKILMILLVVGAVLSALLGFAEFFGLNLNGVFKEKPTNAGMFLRLSGTFSYANIAAMYYEIILPFTVVGLAGALQKRKRGLASLWLLAGGILVEAIFLTYSRGAWLGLAGGLVLMFLAQRKGTLTKPYLLYISLGVGVLWLLTFVFTPLTAIRLNLYSDQEWYRAGYVSQLSTRLNTCERSNITMTVTNLSPFTWQKEGAYKINLTYHWLKADKTVYQFNVREAKLSGDIAPNTTEQISIELLTPPEQGDYFLVWDMHQAGVSWFSLKSANYNPLPVTIVPPNTPAACNLKPANPNFVTPEKLPTSLSSPSREQLWQAALNMLSARPLVGFGAGNFKFNYQEYIVPPPQNPLSRVHANNLYLELLADLGLIGFGLLAGFFGLATLPLLTAIRRGYPATTLQWVWVGVIGVWLVHGILDCFVEPHAPALLFWLVLAFARYEYRVGWGDKKKN